MQLYVGLGNPGPEYKNTRHNVGFVFLDALYKHYQQEWQLNEWKSEKKFTAIFSWGKINGKKIILAKPHTFMNNSGMSVAAITRFYKIKATNITIVHDDIDIPLGKYKIINNKSAAGHRGVESIIAKLGTQEFNRIRVGINPNINNDGISALKIPTEKFVLQKFTNAENKIIKNIFKEIIDTF